MSLERVGIYGTGNVGSALVMELAREVAGGEDIAQQIDVVSRNPQAASAAILDAASAFPEILGIFGAANQLGDSYDVVIHCAGEQPRPEVDQKQLLERNVQVVRKTLSGVVCKTLVVIGTPIDRLTQEISSLEDFPANQIIGFGGELDRARARYHLNRAHKDPGPLYVIGEHGPRAIPVFEGEQDYNMVKLLTRSVLDTIKQAGGQARNLASGVQLGRLVKALAGKEQIMCVSAPYPDYEDLSLTWPHIVNENGLGQPLEITIGSMALADLSRLIAERKEPSA
jgi:malate/lactate dehydrogenase